jgi:uncharacterized membrane protein YdcZ (DUF606 family)
MMRYFRMIFWGLLCLALLGGILGVIWLSIKLMLTPQGGVDLFPLVSVAGLIAIFFPKARGRFVAAAWPDADTKTR